MVLTETQRMALLELIDRLQAERDAAEHAQIYWFRKHQECASKTRI